MARVKNMTSSNGREVANQFIITDDGRGALGNFIITDDGRGALGNFIKRETFQSYNNVIAVKTVWEDSINIEIDETYWDYSTTTGKYRNIFLGEDKKTTEKKIKSGKYKLTNLN